MFIVVDFSLNSRISVHELVAGEKRLEVDRHGVGADAGRWYGQQVDPLSPKRDGETDVHADRSVTILVVGSRLKALRAGISPRIDWKSTRCFASFPSTRIVPRTYPSRTALVVSQEAPNRSMSSSNRAVRRAGFTLVELLVVVAIVGILAGLLLTVVSRGKSRARQIQCANNVRQLGQALQGFRTDHHAFPPLLDPSDHSETRYWQASLNHQMGLPLDVPYDPQGVWNCPATSRPTGGWWDSHGEIAYDDYNYNAYGLGSYRQTNSLGLAEHYSTVASERQTTRVRRVTEGDVVSPSEMLAVGEALYGAAGVVVDGQVFGRANPATLSAFGPSEYDYAASTRRASERHQGRANVVFSDGHVEALTLKTLFEDNSDAALSLWNRDHQPHRERVR